MTPVVPAAATESTIALGTSFCGIWTSSHIAATMPYPVKVSILVSEESSF